MSDCRTCHDRMIEAYYGELDPSARTAFERHLAACEDCRAEYAGLSGTLRLMDKREKPDPGPAFWDGYFDRLSKRMVWEAAGERTRPSLLDTLRRPLARLPRWAFQAAAAVVLLLAGVLIGSRLVGPSGRSGLTAVAARPAGAPSAAVVQAGDFIERSKVLLLGLVNYDPATVDAYAFDLPGKKAVSRRLAAEAPAIRQGLSGPGQRRLRELVADLEVILMQIANLESGQDLDGVEMVKQGVDRKSLFLKIDLDRMAREAGGDGQVISPASKPVKKSQA